MGVYPNPATEEIHVAVEHPANGQMTIQVTDLMGRVMTYKTVEKTQKLVETKLDIRALPEGTYLMKVIHQGAEKVERLYVEKK
ncbi:MAG: T9SS type A sorting domain-containing protein [Bacteroidia bacterium]|nr:T9SS type A sorting domain-containing protein [Bacteroidia bacterium]